LILPTETHGGTFESYKFKVTSRKLPILAANRKRTERLKFFGVCIFLDEIMPPCTENRPKKLTDRFCKLQKQKCRRFGRRGFGRGR